TGASRTQGTTEDDGLRLSSVLKMPYPTSEASPAVYSADTAACHVNPVRASATAVGPSRARDSRNKGIGTTVADHTVRESPPGTRDARETTLPMPQDNAPSRQSVRATTVT